MFRLHFLTSILSIATLVATAPKPFSPPPPPTSNCPVKTSEQTIQGPPWQIGASAAGGTSFTFGETHTIGFTFTEGADLGIKISDVFSLGLSVSVAESISDGTTESVTENCPPGAWTCSLLVYPGMLQVTGYRDIHGGADCKGGPIIKSEGNFTVQIPRKDPSGNGFYEPRLCACKNRVGWADPGAPQPCIVDC